MSCDVSAQKKFRKNFWMNAYMSRNLEIIQANLPALKFSESKLCTSDFIIPVHPIVNYRIEPKRERGIEKINKAQKGTPKTKMNQKSKSLELRYKTPMENTRSEQGTEKKEEEKKN